MAGWEVITDEKELEKAKKAREQAYSSDEGWEVVEEGEKEEGSFLNDLSMDPTNTLLDVAGDVGTKVSSFARGIPVAGKAAEDIGATLAGMSKEEGAEFFQREDEQNPGNIVPQIGGAIASMAPMGIAPALAASAADMTMRDTPVSKMALNLGLEGALGGLGKLAGKAFTKAGSEATKEAAERNAIEALDPTSEQIGKMLDEGDYLAKGRTLLDEGILKDPNKGLIRGLRDKEDILATLNSMYLVEWT
jgi:hypothetical protein